MDATAWNRLRYTVWAPIYDLIARFGRYRRRSIELLALRLGERVLIVGAGTGADLPYIPEGVSVLATDLTPAMLARAPVRPGVETRVMDGQKLDLPGAEFDAVILHLILAVIPDPVACLREASRVLKPGGRIAVFDKFLPDGAKPSLPRRLVNGVTGALFSDINRRMGDILDASGAPLRVERNEPALFGGMFRILLLRHRKVEVVFEDETELTLTAEGDGLLGEDGGAVAGREAGGGGGDGGAGGGVGARRFGKDLTNPRSAAAARCCPGARSGGR